MEIRIPFEEKILHLATTPVSGLKLSRVTPDEIEDIWEMNQVIFGEERIINSFDRGDLTIFLAEIDQQPAGFKIGYRENRFVYYSAKGGVLPAFRRRGVARALLRAMTCHAREMGYLRYAFDTFPNMHPGMTVLALAEGFRLVKADYNNVYREHRLRFELRLNGSSRSGGN